VRNRLDWSLRDWNASLGHTYVPSVDDLANPTPYRVSRYNSWDASFGYTFKGVNNRFLKGLAMQVGVNNFTNANPPLIPSEPNQSHDINAYDAIGRFIYVQAKYKF
jgi:outer membrane receptor protein involved in Fe transport